VPLCRLFGGAGAEARREIVKGGAATIFPAHGQGRSGKIQDERLAVMAHLRRDFTPIEMDPSPFATTGSISVPTKKKERDSTSWTLAVLSELAPRLRGCAKGVSSEGTDRLRGVESCTHPTWTKCLKPAFLTGMQTPGCGETVVLLTRAPTWVRGVPIRSEVFFEGAGRGGFYTRRIFQ